MDKQNRKAIIAGNWKMNKTATEAAELIDALIPAVKDAGCEVVICVPFTDLVTAVAKTKGTNIHVGAENVHFEKSGAFTGEISADMLTDLGVEYVVVGHSERRQYFAETDETVNKRAKAALAGGLKPIICVGESLTQREQTEDGAVDFEVGADEEQFNMGFPQGSENASPSEPFSDSSKSFANSPSPRADQLRAKGERPSVRMELSNITTYLRRKVEPARHF